MLNNIGKNKDLMGALDECLSDAERDLLGMRPSDEKAQALRGRVCGLVEADMTTSQELEPQRRSQDRKDLFPWQGKESDAEIMFNFEDVTDAQDLYDFLLESRLVVPGEVKLHVHEGPGHAQYSVHFAANVLVQKPEVIQMAMEFYRDQLKEGDEGAWNDMVEDVEGAISLQEASARGSAEPRSAGRHVDFNPFHSTDGKFTSRGGLSSGGSWSDGKQVRLKATKKGAKLHFAGTKRPCGREARGKGKDMRCWDGKPGMGLRLHAIFAKKKRLGPTPMPKREGLDRADMATLQEAWVMYGVDLAFAPEGDRWGTLPWGKQVFGRTVRALSEEADSSDAGHRRSSQGEGLRSILKRLGR